MGKYAISTVLPKLLAEDRPVAEAYVRRTCEETAVHAGYTTLGTPVLITNWSPMTELDVFIEKAVSGWEHEVGSVRVRAVIEVEEDHELENGNNEAGSHLS